MDNWVGWVITFVIVIYVAGKFLTGDTQKTQKNSGSNRDLMREAQEIADNVNTIRQFRSLEKKLETAENKMMEAVSERANESASHRYEVLQAAIDIAESKTFQWQFVPEIDLETEKKVLEHAFKTYTYEEFKEISERLNTEDYDWHEINAYDDPEETDINLKAFIKFRTIVESDDRSEDKIKKINQLVSKNKSSFSNYFDSTSSLKPGQQWFAEQLSIDGLPMAYELYEDGYTTPEKCLEIDEQKFLERKGVGPKKLEQLKAYKLKVRDEIDNA